MTDRIEQIIAKALLQPCDNHKDRAALARETARQVMEVTTIARFVEAGRSLTANHDLAKSLSVFVDYWGLDCYAPPAETMGAVRDIVKATLSLLTKEEGQ